MYLLIAFQNNIDGGDWFEQILPTPELGKHIAILEDETGYEISIYTVKNGKIVKTSLDEIPEAKKCYNKVKRQLERKRKRDLAEQNRRLSQYNSKRQPIYNEPSAEFLKVYGENFECSG